MLSHCQKGQRRRLAVIHLRQRGQCFAVPILLELAEAVLGDADCVALLGVLGYAIERILGLGERVP
jgi:hypothetical protein